LLGLRDAIVAARALVKASSTLLFESLAGDSGGNAVAKAWEKLAQIFTGEGSPIGFRMSRFTAAQWRHSRSVRI